MPQYPIIDLDALVSERRYAHERLEDIGSKRKDWFRDQETDERWLFKARRRPEDGEDWAERVAADVAEALGLPHAEYELAVWRDHLGVVSRRFGTDARRLVPGNELLVDRVQVPGYPRSGTRRFSRIEQYTPDLVLDTLINLDVSPNPTWALPDGVATGADVMVGYVLLDALIANSDRHDQNWGIEEQTSDQPEPNAPVSILAPTFDHASSLGREMPDTKREARLSEMQMGVTVQAYLDRPTSRFHRSADDPTVVTPLEAFEIAAARLPDAAEAWLGRLEAFTADETEGFLRRVPPERISEPAIRFAREIIALRRDALLALRPLPR